MVSVAEIQAPLATTARAMRATDGRCAHVRGDGRAAARAAQPVPQHRVVHVRLDDADRPARRPLGAQRMTARRGRGGVGRTCPGHPDGHRRSARPGTDARLRRRRRPGAAWYVLYAERRLSPDPNVRRRSDAPFSQLRYAIYLDTESDAELLGSSERDLPLSGPARRRRHPVRRLSQLLLVASPNGRLGDALTANLWWIVAFVGTLRPRSASSRSAASTVAGTTPSSRRGDRHQARRAAVHRRDAATRPAPAAPRLPPHTEIASPVLAGR